MFASGSWSHAPTFSSFSCYQGDAIPPDVTPNLLFLPLLRYIQLLTHHSTKSAPEMAERSKKTRDT